MKIVHYLYDLGVGGIENMLVNIVNEQVKMNIDVFILVLNNLVDNDVVKRVDSKVRITYVGKPHGSKNFLYILKANFLLKKINPDVIHSHYAKLYRTLLMPSLKRRTCVTQHRNCNGSGSYMLRYFKKVFAISNCVRDDIRSTFGLESTVVYNGIIPSNLILKKNSEKQETFRIVQLGRLYHQDKGQHLLIEAIHILVQRGVKNISVDFIGDGPSKVFLETMIANYGLQNFFHFLGARSQSYLYEHLCEYDLQVQPSLFEGFGLSVAEALAAKLPVLVANCLGPMEVIENGACGEFFAYNDPNDLAKKIEYIVKNGYDENKVNLGYDRVLKMFDVKNTAKTYVDEYKLFLLSLANET